MSLDNPSIKEYAKFQNSHYDFVAQLDDRSSCPSTGDASDRFWYAQLKKKAEKLKIESKNIIELFSLAKKPSYIAKVKRAYQAEEMLS